MMLSRIHDLFKEKTLVAAESLEEMRAWVNEEAQRMLNYDAPHIAALNELMLLSEYLHEQTQDADYLYSYAMAALDLAFIDALEQSRTDDIYTYTYCMCDKAFEALRSMWEADPCERTFQRVVEGLKLCRSGQSRQYGGEQRVDIEFEQALQIFLHALQKHDPDRLEVRRMLAYSYGRAADYHREREELGLADGEERCQALEEERLMRAKELALLKGIWEETLDETDKWRLKDVQRQMTEPAEQEPAESGSMFCALQPFEEQMGERTEGFLPAVLLMDTSMSMADAFANRTKNRRKRG